MLCVEHGGALLEHDAGNLVSAKHFLRTPAGIDDNAVLAGFRALLKGCGHNVLGLEGKHGYLRGAAAHCNAGCIYGNVAAANHNHLAGNLLGAAVGFVEEVNGGSGAGEGFSGNSGETAALAADGDIKCLVTLLTELGDGNVLAHFNAGTDLYADLLHDVDFGLEDVLGKLVGRDAVAEHAAGLFILFKHGGLVTHCGKVICAAHAGGAAADDRYLLLPAVLDIGADIHLGDKAGFGIEVLLCDELLDGIDSDGLVYGSAGAGVLAAAVANAAADCRERVFTLDELKGLRELSFGGLLEIALNRNVGGAGCLTGRCAGFVAVDAVLVTVVLSPLVLSPLGGIRKLVLRILDGTAVGAKFLA